VEAEFWDSPCFAIVLEKAAVGEVGLLEHRKACKAAIKETIENEERFKEEGAKRKFKFQAELYKCLVRRLYFDDFPVFLFCEGSFLLSLSCLPDFPS